MNDQPTTPTPAGILLIDKPLRMTSMDVCAIVRARLRRGGAPKRIKVGHGGTLDPLATGLLVVLVGKATPLCNRIMEGVKTYETEVDLSAFTTTDDMEGERTEVAPARQPTEADIHAALARFTGVIMQTPPAYSAISIQGRRAYDIARSGGTPQLAPRPVNIHALSLVSYAWPLLTLSITCGKGTYIRSLARDIGVTLGTGGTLRALRRTRSGRFDVRDARGVKDLPEIMSQADLMPIPADLNELDA